MNPRRSSTLAMSHLARETLKFRLSGNVDTYGGQYDIQS